MEGSSKLLSLLGSWSRSVRTMVWIHSILTSELHGRVANFTSDRCTVVERTQDVYWIITCVAPSQFGHIWEENISLPFHESNSGLSISSLSRYTDWAILAPLQQWSVQLTLHCVLSFFPLTSWCYKLLTPTVLRHYFSDLLKYSPPPQLRNRS